MTTIFWEKNFWDGENLQVIFCTSKCF